MTDDNSRSRSGRPLINNGSCVTTQPQSDRRASLTQVAAQEVRVVKRKRRLSSNWVLLFLVLLVWSVAIGLYLHSFPLMSSTPVQTQGSPAITRQPMPPRSEVSTPVIVSTAEKTAAELPPEPESATAMPPTVAEDIEPPRVRLVIGPFVGSEERSRALSVLTQKGLKVQRLKGSGPVRMIRLLEGVYPGGEAEAQLQRVREQVDTAFLLPRNGRWALYAGSFHQQALADDLQTVLARSNIRVTQERIDLSMSGELLVIESIDQQAATEVAENFRASEINVQIGALDKD